MPDWSYIEGQRAETFGAVTASTRGTVVTANATANTKGTTYTELVASTPIETNQLIIELIAFANVDFLVDIAIGASSAEQVIVANLTCSAGSGAQLAPTVYSFPITIPSGARLSARCQATTGSSGIRVLLVGLTSGFLMPMGLGRIATYGAATADSGGTSVDPGATIHTKGAWSVLSAATDHDMRGFVMGIGNQLNGVRLGMDWLVDVGIGGAGVEQTVLDNFHMCTSTVFDTVFPQAWPFIPVNIPAGTRLVVRAQCSSNDATDRLFDAIIYGID